MMISQRFPGYYDGILACSPGFRLPKAALFGEVWDTQVYANLAKSMGIYDRFGQPLLTKTFTDEDLDLAAQAILSACDRLDGLEDGIIDNFPACTSEVVSPKLAAITCKSQKRNTCLSAAQVGALQKVFAGPRNSKGEMLYADWAWDRGIGGKTGEAYNQGWRFWKLGPYDAPVNSGLNATLGSGAVSAIFTTPPTPVATSGAAPVAHLLSIDFDRDAAKLYAESGTYTKSAWDFMMAVPAICLASRIGAASSSSFTESATRFFHQRHHQLVERREPGQPGRSRRLRPVVRGSRHESLRRRPGGRSV